MTREEQGNRTSRSQPSGRGSANAELTAGLNAEPSAAFTPEQIKHMVDRFLGWRLPEDFRPDAGISFEPEFNVEFMASLGKPPMRHRPTGTNLLDAGQAEAMVRHILAGLVSPCDARLLDAAENVVIAWGMGWDLHGAVSVLADVVDALQPEAASVTRGATAPEGAPVSQQPRDLP